MIAERVPAIRKTARRRLVCGALTLLVALALVGSGRPVAALGVGISENEVKAAFIYNFLKFIQWPDSDTTDVFTVGVVGPTDLTAALRQIVEDRQVRGIPIAVVEFAAADDVDSCHILVVPEEEQGNLQSIIERSRNKSILTVGESAGMATRGVGINLIRADDKIRLEINKAVTDREELRISPQLLMVATIIDNSADREVGR